MVKRVERRLNMSGGGCSEVPFNVCKLFQVWTFLLSLTPTMSGYTWSTTTGKSVLDHSSVLSPVFDNVPIKPLEATEGQTLLLPCTVRHLGDKVVSWIRSRDLHILTSGPFTFSSDNRFESVPSPAGDFWGLRIRGVHLSDTGQYECQVNTDPKMSLAINLTVSGARKLEGTTSRWVGQALIKGPSEVYVRDGSQVTFTCEISPLSVASSQSGAHGVFMTAKPKVRWLHANKELFSGTRSHIYTETLLREKSHRMMVIGILKISKVSWRDSGQYTCLQMSVKPDSIKLFVVENEHSEAMQRDYPISSSTTQMCSTWVYLVAIMLYFPT